MFEIGQLTRLPLGYVGESGTRTISIDMKAWLDEYPGALIMIQVIRPVDHYKYPAAYTKTDGVIHWTVGGSEVMYAGKGLAQIALYNPDTKQEYKSRVVGTIVAESLDGFNDILLEETDPASKWVNQVLEAAESAEASKNDAANSKEEAAAAVAIVSMQKNEALIAIQNEGAAQVVSVNDAGTQQAQFVEAKGEEVLGKIPEDYTELSNSVATLSEDIARNTAPAIIPTATGSIVTITDGAARPSVEVISHIAPVETGTGEKGPNNPWTISGWNSVTAIRTGRNLLDLASMGGAYVNGAYVFTESITKIIPLPIGYSGKYTITADIEYNSLTARGLYFEIRYKDGTKDTVGVPNANGGSKHYQLITKNNVERIVMTWGSAGVVTTFRNAQIETGETATPYEPYQDKNLSADLPETVYGGMKNWTTGKLSVELAKLVINGSEQIRVNGVGTTVACYLPFNALPPGRHLLVCDRFPSVSGVNNVSNIYAADRVFYVSFAVELLSTPDLAGVRAWLADNPLTVIYPLATPYTIQLTPQQLDTLKGINNVWSNCGDTTLSYVADTKMYIDQKLAAIAAATL